MLKPQDIVVLLKLALGPPDWTYSSLAQALGMSASEVHAAVHRAEDARLFDTHRRVVRRANLMEFLKHGIQYAFPVHEGPVSRGMATSLAAPPLQRDTSVVYGDAVPVWPTAEGHERGPAISPLYRSVPEAASKDADLYRILALVDAVRIGRARERNEGRALLREALHRP